MGTIGIAEGKLSACARDWQGLCSAAPNGYPAALRATPAKILCSEIALPGYVGSWVEIRTSPALLSSFHKPPGPSAHSLCLDRKSTRLNSSHRCISYAV